MFDRAVADFECQVYCKIRLIVYYPIHTFHYMCSLLTNSGVSSHPISTKMSWNSSKLVRFPRSVQAVKPSRKYIKAEQEISTNHGVQVSTQPIGQMRASKPTGYFNQAMVRLSPESDAHIQPQAVKYSYASSAISQAAPKVISKAVKYSHTSFTAPSPAVKHTLQASPKPPAQVRQINPSKYQQAIAHLETIWVSKAKKDLQTIEVLLENITQILQSNQPSKTTLRDTFRGLSQRLSAYSHPTSASENLTPTAAAPPVQPSHNVLLREQFIEPSETDINEFSARSIRNLQGEKIILQRELVQLTESHKALEKQVLSSSSELNQLTQKTAEQYHLTSDLQASIQAKNLILQSTYDNLETQSTQIELLNLKIDRLNQHILELNSQHHMLSLELTDRDHLVAKRDRTITSLNTQLTKYEQIRVLEGNYIAIPSSKGSKYHFHKKCPGWKMLVGEYMLNLDPSRAVVSSKDPTFFIKGGLSECLDCKNKTH